MSVFEKFQNERSAKTITFSHTANTVAAYEAGYTLGWGAALRCVLNAAGPRPYQDKRDYATLIYDVEQGLKKSYST